MTFVRRLNSAKENGRLTTTDLSIWFERPYHTVRGWLEGKEPWGVYAEDVSRHLDILEKLIAKRNGFPVPAVLSPSDRRKHMKKARHERVLSERERA